MAEVTLEFLGEQMQRLFGELRRMDGKLDQKLRGIDGKLDQIREEITVLTGAFMRLDAEREGRELSAAGLLAGQRRLADRLAAVEDRLERLETRRDG
jgi:chromosome segregation ATPase